MKEVEALDPFDPDYPHLWLKAEHLGRYLFVADQLLAQRPDKAVLDVACGTGYGAREMAATGATVIAVDRAEQIQLAKQVRRPSMTAGTYPASGAERRGRTAAAMLRVEAPVTWLPVDLDNEDLAEALERSVLGLAGCVTCFETLEHVQEPDRLLHMLRASLAPGGRLYLSVPMAHHEPVQKNGAPKNPFHRHLFRREGVEALLAQAGFSVQAVYGQPLCNLLFRREMHLLSGTGRRPTDFYQGTPEVIYHYARLVGYPGQAQVEDSYALLWVAEAEG